MTVRRIKRKKSENTEAKEGAYGADRSVKLDTAWRFYVGNIGTLPSKSSDLGIWKLDIWRELVIDGEIQLLSEINKDLGVAKENEQLEELVKGFSKSACDTYVLCARMSVVQVY
jgi:hypothetical protein